MNGLELGVVIKSRALLTEQRSGGMWEKRLKGREKGDEKSLSPFLSAKRCAIEHPGQPAESLHVTRSAVLAPFTFSWPHTEPARTWVSLRTSSPHPVTVNVIGICTGEVLTRHFPFSVHDVELLAKEGGQTNGRHHSVASPPSRGEI